MTQQQHSLPGGTVAFVGAGPGDPELLTLRALRLLTQADAVLHDYLVPDDILALAPQARLVPVGKAGFGPSMKQDDINALIIEHARAGERVVRLKSGDPMIFGRGGEEASLAALTKKPTRLTRPASPFTSRPA